MSNATPHSMMRALIVVLGAMATILAVAIYILANRPPRPQPRAVNDEARQPSATIGDDPQTAEVRKHAVARVETLEEENGDLRKQLELAKSSLAVEGKEASQLRSDLEATKRQTVDAAEKPTAETTQKATGKRPTTDPILPNKLAANDAKNDKVVNDPGGKLAKAPAPKPDAAALPPANGQQEAAIRGKAEAAADADILDTRLKLEEIQKLRGRNVLCDLVVDTVVRRGRGFDVTEDAERKLRGLGFRPAQIDVIKQSSEPLVPGKWLFTPEKNRDDTLKVMTQIAARSGADIHPFATQHVTLWVAKGSEKIYLPDLQRLERLYHTKCEPIRSGLDKRSAHIFLLKNNAEYQAWCRAMFDSPVGKRFDKIGGGAGAFYREHLLKMPTFSTYDVCVASTGEGYPLQRFVVNGVADMFLCQLRPFEKRQERFALTSGFVNATDTALFGDPEFMETALSYGADVRSPWSGGQPWNQLVKQRMTDHQATPLDELLRMEASAMKEPHYAEGWTLVGLLNKQPEKFGKLLLELRQSNSEIEAIEKIYGWDEKKLTQEWHMYVMALGSKGTANSL